MKGAPYTPSFSEEQLRVLSDWHESAYRDMRERGAVRVNYLGLELEVPAQVFAPTPTSDLLGSAVRAEVRETDRVLDMGTGCGVNAILAAQRAREVLGVDVNPHAIAAAAANAELNGVAARTHFKLSDVFDQVEGTFDLMIIDPPFRWFAPRDLLEHSIADQGYRALTRFLMEAHARLNPGGRVLLFFGTSGDAAYLDSVVAQSGLTQRTIATRDLERGEVRVSYFTRLLTRG